MLTLDPITLFFYSHIVSNNDQEPPSKKRKPADPISTWIESVQDNAPPSSRAASSTGKSNSQTTTSLHPPPSLTAGSTRSSSNSVLTNNILITANPPLPTTTAKKEPKEARIEVRDGGAFSDYDETNGQERERALAGPPKHGVRATSSVSLTCLFFSILNLPLLVRTWSPRTKRSPLWLPGLRSLSRRPNSLMGSTTSSSAAPSFLQ